MVDISIKAYHAVLIILPMNVYGHMDNPIIWEEPSVGSSPHFIDA